MSNNANKRRLVPTRRTFLKSVGVSGSSLTIVGSATAASNNSIYFSEYSVYGEVDESGEFVQYYSNYLPGHKVTSDNELIIDRKVLTEEEETLFKEYEDVVWGTKYHTLPVSHSRNDPYILADGYTKRGLNPTITFSSINNQDNSPNVKLQREGTCIKMDAQGNSQMVDEGRTGTFTLQSHNASIKDHNNKTVQVSVIPKVFIRNFGTLKVKWLR